MDINKLLENYGIYLLIIIYIIINIAYKKVINIVIFLMSLLATVNLVEKKINAVLIAYILSICYGIIVNFHLLENFKSSFKEKRRQISSSKLFEKKQSRDLDSEN